MEEGRIGLWAVDQCIHPYEMECRNLMVRQLLETFDGLSPSCHIQLELVFGLRLPGAEIDLLALTPNGVFVGEMKRAYGKLRGEMNGPWFEVTDHGVHPRKGRENPWAQIRRYRSEVVSSLESFEVRNKSRVFTETNPYKACKAGLVQVPVLNLDSTIQEPWWYACGVGDWIPKIVRSQGPELILLNGATRWLETLGCQRLSLRDAAYALQIPIRRHLIPEGTISASLGEWQPILTLDDKQTCAASHPYSDHIAVIAGPGSGKTRVVVERTRFLSGKLGLRDWMGVVSYTNSAADEIRSRLSLPESLSDRVFVGTFHRFAINVLKKSSSGFAPRAILDEHAATWRYACICGISAMDAKAQLRDVTANRIEELSEDVQDRWKLFLKHLRSHRVATFESLLYEMCRIAEDEPSVLPSFLVYDEFQDVSPMQGRLVRQLFDAGTKITVVGDPEQSIFGFNGCTPQSLIEFAQGCRNGSVIELETNHRSHDSIVAVASKLRRTPGTALKLKASGVIKTGGWQSSRFISGADQASAVVEWISHLYKKQEIPLGEIAVLFREWKSLLPISSALSAAGVAFRCEGRRTGHPRPIREIATLIGIGAKIDDPERFMAVLEVAPKISQGLTRQIIAEGASREPVTIRKVGALATYLPDRYRAELAGLIQTLERVLAKRHDDPAAEARWLWCEIVQPCLSIEEARHKQELAATVELWADYLALSPTTGVDDLQAGLKEAGNEGDIDEDVVSLATIHAAKGREWKAVAVIDICDDAFMKSREDLAEEIRLLHVACSRAINWLFLGFPDRRGLVVDTGKIRSLMEEYIGSSGTG